MGKIQILLIVFLMKLILLTSFKQVLNILLYTPFQTETNKNEKIMKMDNNHVTKKSALWLGVKGKKE